MPKAAEDRLIVSRELFRALIEGGFLQPIPGSHRKGSGYGVPTGPYGLQFFCILKRPHRIRRARLTPKGVAIAPAAWERKRASKPAAKPAASSPSRAQAPRPVQPATSQPATSQPAAPPPASRQVVARTPDSPRPPAPPPRPWHCSACNADNAPTNSSCFGCGRPRRG
jgi:hypothetical protein